MSISWQEQVHCDEMMIIMISALYETTC